MITSMPVATSSGAAPKTWSDLLDQKFKGQLITTDPSYTALGLMTLPPWPRRSAGITTGNCPNETMIVQGNSRFLTCSSA